MATVTTSIGMGTTHDSTALTISSVSGAGPYTVTMNSGETANFDVGDALWDEHATPRKYLVTGISGDDLTVRDTESVGSAPDNSGTSSAAAKRYYNGSTPLADWEADLDDTGLYASADDAVGEMWNDAAYTERITYNGGATVGLSSITLTVPSSERHDGTNASGSRIEIASSTNNPITASTSVDFHLSWLEVDCNGFGTGTYKPVNIFNPATATVKNCIIHDTSSSGERWGIEVNTITTLVVITNNIIYDITKSTGSGGAHAYGVFLNISSWTSKTAHICNNTIHNTTNLGSGSGNCEGIHIDVDDTAITIKNNIVTDTNGNNSATKVDFDATISTAATGTNLSSDTSAPGSGSLVSKTAANQFVSTTGGSEDFHLKTGADAIDAGTDLVTTPSGVEIDIDGRDRNAEADTWDIGADELVAAGGGGSVPVFHHHYQTLRSA